MVLGHTQMGCQPMTLDFRAGLIRHEATVEYDGFESSDDTVGRVGVAQSSVAGTFDATGC